MNVLLFILLIAVALGFFTGKIWADAAYKFQKKVTCKTFLWKYHAHHSLGGLLIILFGIIFPTASLKLFTVGFGFGIFLQHTIDEGLIFITKEKQ